LELSRTELASIHKDMFLVLATDAGLQKAYHYASAIGLLDSASYFLNVAQLQRTFDSDYIPNDQDILRSRVSTTGIIEKSFQYEGVKFQMVDVGGQRGERRKWIHCFDSVKAILWIAALSEYDQVSSKHY